MRFYVLILFLFVHLFNGQQDYHFTYRLKAMTNLDTNKKVIEDFFLIIDRGNRSFFVGEKFSKIDSLKKSLTSKDGSATSMGFVNLADVPKTNFKFIVEKNWEDGKVKFYDNLLKYKYVYEEQPIFNWSIQNETTEIGKFNCKKAVMSAYGRDWIAWFTSDIPLNDGPYKFSGLPGLIIKISDTQEHFTFELIGVDKRIGSGGFTLDENIADYRKVSKTDYLKAVRNINENILKEVENMGIFINKEDQNALKKRTNTPRNRLELIP